METPSSMQGFQIKEKPLSPVLHGAWGGGVTLQSTEANRTLQTCTGRWEMETEGREEKGGQAKVWPQRSKLREPRLAWAQTFLPHTADRTYPNTEALNSVSGLRTTRRDSPRSQKQRVKQRRFHRNPTRCPAARRPTGYYANFYSVPFVGFLLIRNTRRVPKSSS